MLMDNRLSSFANAPSFLKIDTIIPPLNLARIGQKLDFTSNKKTASEAVSVELND